MVDWDRDSVDPETLEILTLDFRTSQPRTPPGSKRRTKQANPLQAIADFQRVIELNPTAGDDLVAECGGDAGSDRVVRLKRNVTREEGFIECAAALDITRVY